jgi:DNA integrity scanning protein DisA with diadenylate cyclase activity
VTLQEAAGGVVVQRHPTGHVRVFGPSGLVRWDGISWYHEPPVGAWVDALSDTGSGAVKAGLRTALRFAVHELSARHVGATLICRPNTAAPPLAGWDQRFPTAPPLTLRDRGGSAALRHVLSQIDGAAVLSPEGDLLHLGVRLVPSPRAEQSISPVGGTRHTSAIRYSYDDPDAVVIVVSEDGPVTVMHHGRTIASASEQICHRVDETEPRHAAS